jgi:hypothetical protein
MPAAAARIASKKRGWARNAAMAEGESESVSGAAVAGAGEITILG